MRVSYLELYVHCRKVFEACGVPYGVAEESAETVAWGEFSGLCGLTVLKDELDQIQSANMKTIQKMNEQADFILLDGAGQSGLLTGKVAADFAVAKVEEKQSIAVYVKNTSTSNLLAKQAAYIAANGMGGAIHWVTEEGNSVWAVASSKQSHPTILKGDVKEIMKDMKLSNLLYEQYRITEQLVDANSFLVICTKNVEMMEKVLQAVQQQGLQDTITLEITPAKTFQSHYKMAWKFGAKVERDLWDELNETGKKTLVESSELSRLRGAGEMASI